MKYKVTISTLLPVALFLTVAPTAFANTTWYVNGVSGNDNNNCKFPMTACQTIGHAIALASSGDSIRVAAATYFENLAISTSLNIIGNGAAATIVDGAGAGTVVTISNAAAHVILSGLTISNGEVQGYGGGPFPKSTGGGINNSGTLTIANSTVSGNSARIPCIPLGLVCLSRGAALGGGIYNSGALIISNSTISGNSAGSYCNAAPCSAFGGGIYNKGTLVMIRNSTLTSNFAGTGCSTSIRCLGAGGAFYSVGGTVTLNNSTVEGNSASHCSAVCVGTGGAIVNGSGNLALNNSTVSGNPAGGIVGTATLQNSILANKSVPNCSGTITSHGYNLSSDYTCNFNKIGDLNHTDPMLGPLQYNGGPTQTMTMALPSGSPAIDAGDPSGCTDGHGHLLKTDQRGMPRPDTEDHTTTNTGRCDMGAYERQSD